MKATSKLVRINNVTNEKSQQLGNLFWFWFFILFYYFMKTPIYDHKPQPESLYCLNFLHARCYDKESKRSSRKNTEKKKIIHNSCHYMLKGDQTYSNVPLTNEFL